MPRTAVPCAPARARSSPRPPWRAVVAALLLLAAGCGGSSDNAGGPMALESARLATTPRRIVPSSARALEFAADLVGPERIAGLPEQGFEYAVLGADEPRFAALPRFKVYQAESVLALAPDLVLGDPWQAAEANQRLVEAGVAVVLLPVTSGWRDAVEVLRGVGRLVGEEARAERVIADVERRVAALQREAPRRAGLRALPYANFGSKGFSGGAGTTIDTTLGLAGLTNVAAEGGRRGHPAMTFEELLVLDPDVIVVGAPLHTDVGHAGDRSGASEQILLSEPSLASLRAVRERRIVALPPGLYASASHHVVDAAEVLAREVDALLARLAPGEPEVER